MRRVSGKVCGQEMPLWGGIAVDATFDPVGILSWKRWGSHSGQGRAVTGLGCVGRQASHSVEGRENEGLPVGVTSTGCFWMQGNMGAPVWLRLGAEALLIPHDTGLPAPCQLLSLRDCLLRGSDVTPRYLTRLHPLRNITTLETQAGPKGYSHIYTRTSSRRNSAPAL